MEKKQPPVIIFGAGKTGLGFAAHLAHLSGYPVILVDKDADRIEKLRKDGKFAIHIAGNSSMDCSVFPGGVYHVDDPAWHTWFSVAEIAFTAVFGNNFPELSSRIATALEERNRHNPESYLNIITCENYNQAASTLKNAILQNAGGEFTSWISEKTGVVEAMVLKTCLESPGSDNGITITAQNLFDLPCDAEAFRGKKPALYGLKPLAHFGNQLERKIYTYNCINAVITYLGALKGYSWLYEAAGDPAIDKIARKAAEESSAALVAEYGFDPAEQAGWVESAFTKFRDHEMDDPIERNGADPVRKLSRKDRLTGPALLALKHGIYPSGIIQGLQAAFEFRDKPGKIRISERIEKEGPGPVLEQVCQLSPGEPLYAILMEQYKVKGN